VNGPYGVGASRCIVVAAHALAGCLVPLAALTAQDAGPEFTVRTIDGGVVRASALQLRGEALRLAIAGGGERELRLDDVAACTRDGGAARAPAPAGELRLRSGQRLRADLAAADGDRLTFRAALAKAPLVVPLRTVRALRFAAEAKAGYDGMERAIADASDRDLLFAHRGAEVTRHTVAVIGFEGSGADLRLRVRFAGKEQEPQPLDKFYGLVLGQGAAPDPQAGPRATVALADGESVAGRLLALDTAADECRVRLDEGGELVYAASDVLALRVSSDRLVYLSDLEPSVEQTAALRRIWPWLRDRAPLGDGIELGGTRFERGIAMIPRTRLTFDLHGRYDWFEAVVGIDARAGPLGHAVIRILGDDRVLFEVPAVTRASAQRVRISVKDVRRLTLVADFGDDLDFGDHCCFADARLLRES
jgi:hypothetical protein